MSWGGTGEVCVLNHLRGMNLRELHDLFEQGHPVGIESIGNTDYRGVSLGIPHLVERMFWTTFVKTFRWKPEQRRLLGWNVRIEQTGLNGPVRPLRDKTGDVESFGPFEVVEVPIPGEMEPAGSRLLLHYGRGAPGSYSPLRLLRDPIVSLDAGGTQRLLGRTLIEFGVSIPTPSYFLLEKLDSPAWSPIRTDRPQRFEGECWHP